MGGLAPPMDQDAAGTAATTELRLPGAGLTLAPPADGDPDEPPIVLLHGGGQTRHAWGTAGEVSAASGRYALSAALRGHGDSDWAPDGDYTLDAFGRDTHEAVRSLAQ